MSSIPFNPSVTTNASGLFNITADGVITGTMQDDPAKRFELDNGVLASTETLPMWGGVGIQELLTTAGSPVLGNNIARAADQAHLTGFSVFNQAANGITTPQSPVPQIASGMQVNFVRLGSGVKLWLPLDPAIVSTLEAGNIAPQVSWDYTNQKIVAYDSTAALPIKLLAIQTTGVMSPSYNSGTGALTWATSSNAAALVLI